MVRRLRRPRAAARTPVVLDALAPRLQARGRRRRVRRSRRGRARAGRGRRGGRVAAGGRVPRRRARPRRPRATSDRTALRGRRAGFATPPAGARPAGVSRREGPARDAVRDRARPRDAPSASTLAARALFPQARSRSWRTRRSSRAYRRTTRTTRWGRRRPGGRRRRPRCRRVTSSRASRPRRICARSRRRRPRTRRRARARRTPPASSCPPSRATPRDAALAPVFVDTPRFLPL